MANRTSSPAIAMDYAKPVGPRPHGRDRAHFLRAALYTALDRLSVFTFGYYFERYILNRHPDSIRFIREGSEAAMRRITIPHILIGFFFMISSPKNRNAGRQRLWAAGLLMAGAALCDRLLERRRQDESLALQ